MQPMEPVEPPIQLDPETRQGAGIELDDDPFAKVEGVKVLSPPQDEAALQEDVVRRQKESKGMKDDVPVAQVDVAPVDGPSTAPAPVRPALVKQSSSRREKHKDETPEEREERRRERRRRRRLCLKLLLQRRWLRKFQVKYKMMIPRLWRQSKRPYPRRW